MRSKTLSCLQIGSTLNKKINLIFKKRKVHLLFHYFLFVILLNLNYYKLQHDHYYKQVLNENIELPKEYLLYTKNKYTQLKKKQQTS